MSGMNGICDNYTYLNQSPDSTGFTNNWLEARHSNKLFTQRYSDYKLYDEPIGRENTSYRNILGNLFTRNAFTDLYFSSNNLQFVKKTMCDMVYKKTGYIITPEAQNDNNVLTIMRYMYIEHAKHLEPPTDRTLSPKEIQYWRQVYNEQIAELNLKTLIDMVPRVIEKIQQELSYQRDQGNQPMTMDHPVSVSSAGTRANRSVSSFFV